MYKIFILLFFPLVPFCEEPLDVAQISEAMGHIIGKSLDAMGLDFDLGALVKGLKDESEGKSSPLNEDECIQAIATLQEEKILEISEKELQEIDALSNGDQIDENRSLPTPNSPKYR